MTEEQKTKEEWITKLSLDLNLTINDATKSFNDMLSKVKVEHPEFTDEQDQYGLAYKLIVVNVFQIRKESRQKTAEMEKEAEKHKADNIKELLTEERRKFQGLGQGYHSGQFYYGSTIEDEGKVQNCVVTSKRKIYIDTFDPKADEGEQGYDEIKYNFGLNYRFDFFEDVLDFTWTRNSIRKWLYGNYEVDIKKVFEKIVEVNQKWMRYENERIHKFVVLDIMKTYWFQLFQAQGRTYFLAEAESGKTNQLMIYKAFAFNPITSADFSHASIYRIIESTGATILFDDFDELPEDQRKSVIRHIRVNYKKMKTLRADGGTQFKPQAYNSFSHLVFNNVGGLGNDYITPLRLFIIRLLKHPEVTAKPFDADSSKWTPLRDDLYICGLKYYREVMDNYNSLKVDGLSSRHLEIISPILAIAKTISDELYEEMVEFYKELIQHEEMRDISEDLQFILLKELWSRVKDTNEKVEVGTKDLSQIIGVQLGHNELTSQQKSKQAKGLTISIGLMLKSFLLKSRQVTGRTYYTISKKEIENILTLKGICNQVMSAEPQPEKKKFSIKDIDWNL